MSTSSEVYNYHVSLVCIVPVCVEFTLDRHLRGAPHLTCLEAPKLEQHAISNDHETSPGPVKQDNELDSKFIIRRQCNYMIARFLTPVPSAQRLSKVLHYRASKAWIDGKSRRGLACERRSRTMHSPRRPDKGRIGRRASWIKRE